MNIDPDLTTATGRDWARRIAEKRADGKPAPTPKRPPAHVTGRMNKTEAAFARRLEAMLTAGQIAGWWFEPFKVRLDEPETGRACWYTVDFLIIEMGGPWVFAEVKGGHIFEDSVIKWKWAASKFAPWGRWEMWQRKGKGGEFSKIRVALGGTVSVLRGDTNAH